MSMTAAASRPLTRRVAGLVIGLGTALGLTGCGAADGGEGNPGSDQGAGLVVLTAVYPLQFVAERVGGDDIEVRALTPAGAEPHDLELSPAQVREVGDADVVVYIRGFQPSVDAAVDARAPEHAVDAGAAGLEDGSDPHLWLDPTRLAEVGSEVADALTAVDPERAADYAGRLEDLTAELTTLDAELRAGLETCEGRTIVTTHDAFGYLTGRYDLEQLPISGLDPEAEPSPARLREVAAAAQEADVTTIFTEELLNPRVAATLATDLGLRTAVLDPLESQADPDLDYLEVMRANLAALRTALRCT